MRGTAVAFCFNAPRWISCVGPLIGLFFILGVVAAPFLPKTNGKPLPHGLWEEDSAPSAGPAS
jgi:hypothetical protein